MRRKQPKARRCSKNALVGHCHPLIEPFEDPVAAADVLNHLKVGDGHTAVSLSPP